MADRIPISNGFYVKFSPNGRALSAGREEDEVLPEVLFWLRMNPGHQNNPPVQQWYLRKQEQIKEDLQQQRSRLEREKINKAVDRAARQSGCRDKAMIELVREEVFRTRGVPQYED